MAINDFTNPRIPANIAKRAIRGGRPTGNAPRKDIIRSDERGSDRVLESMMDRLDKTISDSKQAIWKHVSYQKPRGSTTTYQLTPTAFDGQLDTLNWTETEVATNNGNVKHYYDASHVNAQWTLDVTTKDARSGLLTIKRGVDPSGFNASCYVEVNDTIIYSASGALNYDTGIGDQILLALASGANTIGVTVYNDQPRWTLELGGDLTRWIDAVSLNREPEHGIIDASKYASVYDAVDALDSTNRTIHLPAGGGKGTNGVYPMSTTATVPSNTTIRGDGWDSVIELEGSALSTFEVIGVENVILKDFQIDGGGLAAQDANAISIGKSQNILVDHVYIHDIGVSGYECDGVYMAGVSGVTVQNSRLTHCARNGIAHGEAWAAVSDVRIINNRCEYNNIAGISLEPVCTRMACDGNYLVGNKVGGIVGAATASRISYGVSMCNNIIDGQGTVYASGLLPLRTNPTWPIGVAHSPGANGMGISQHIGRTGVVHGLTMTGNLITGLRDSPANNVDSGYGISVNLAHTAGVDGSVFKNINISNNTITDVDRMAIFAYSQYQPVENVSICDNNITDSNRNDNGVEEVIRIRLTDNDAAASGLVCQGNNIIISSQGVGNGPSKGIGVIVNATDPGTVGDNSIYIQDPTILDYYLTPNSRMMDRDMEFGTAISATSTWNTTNVNSLFYPVESTWQASYVLQSPVAGVVFGGGTVANLTDNIDIDNGYLWLASKNQVHMVTNVDDWGNRNMFSLNEAGVLSFTHGGTTEWEMLTNGNQNFKGNTLQLDTGATALIAGTATDMFLVDGTTGQHTLKEKIRNVASDHQQEASAGDTHHIITFPATATIESVYSFAHGDHAHAGDNVVWNLKYGPHPSGAVDIFTVDVTTINDKDVMNSVPDITTIAAGNTLWLEIMAATHVEEIHVDIIYYWDAS